MFGHDYDAKNWLTRRSRGEVEGWRGLSIQSGKQNEVFRGEYIVSQTSTLPALRALTKVGHKNHSEKRYNIMSRSQMWSPIYLFSRKACKPILYPTYPNLHQKQPQTRNQDHI